MKDWFPFTSYEFYAYVAAGIIVIAAVDYSFAGATLSGRPEWSAAQAVFWILATYLVGQLIAAPSSAVLEHWIARKIFLPPIEVALRTTSRRKRELFVAYVFAYREYSPLPAPMTEKIRQKACSHLGISSEELTAESIFEIAFSIARSNSDTDARLDQFLNLYGFSRNICFSAFVATLCLGIRAYHEPDRLTLLLLIGTAILCIGMYGRFVKFYAAYSRDVLRTYSAM